jgi:hypothetical protein
MWTKAPVLPARAAAAVSVSAAHAYRIDGVPTGVVLACHLTAQRLQNSRNAAVGSGGSSTRVRSGMLMCDGAATAAETRQHAMDTFAAKNEELNWCWYAATSRGSNDHSRSEATVAANTLFVAAKLVLLASTNCGCGFCVQL